jgi:hypothetical protein
MNDLIIQLKRKHELLLKVLELTRLQETLIKNDNTDALLTTIGERQGLIDELDLIQAELPDKESLRQNTECLQLITVVNGVLNQIQEQDVKNEQAGLERMEHLREQLRKVSDGRRSVVGYDSPRGDDVQGHYINKGK